MKASTRTVSASELRAKCSEILHELQTTGGELVITKHGQPIAKLAATSRPTYKTSRGSVKGRIRGDIVYVNLWQAAR